jgi:hypothetical protein
VGDALETGVAVGSGTDVGVDAPVLTGVGVVVGVGVDAGVAAAVGVPVGTPVGVAVSAAVGVGFPESQAASKPMARETAVRKRAGVGHAIHQPPRTSNASPIPIRP